MEIFRSIDVKNRGFLSSSDFRRLCQDLDVGLTNGQIVQMFHELDTDQDGRITGQDFVRGHKAFTELFIAAGVEPPSDVIREVTSDGDTGGRAAWKRLVERYEVELTALLTSVRYIHRVPKLATPLQISWCKIVNTGQIFLQNVKHSWRRSF